MFWASLFQLPSILVSKPKGKKSPAAAIHLNPVSPSHYTKTSKFPQSSHDAEQPPPPLPKGSDTPQHFRSSLKANRCRNTVVSLVVFFPPREYLSILHHQTSGKKKGNHHQLKHPDFSWIAH